MKYLFVISLALLALANGAPPTRVGPKPRLDGRIVGGQPVQISDFPWQASLNYFNSHICGGFLISATSAVTAGHCTYGASASSLSVRLGSSLHLSGGIVLPILQYFEHPQFDFFNIDYDISILQLSATLNFGPTISAVGLPYQDQYIEAGTNSTVSGWGSLYEGGSLAAQLQAVTVPIVSLAECRAAYGAASVTDRMICAGIPQGGQDACQGDSGGALVIGNVGYRLAVGIVSWGFGCAQPGFPGVYSRVPSFRSWIATTAWT